MYFSVILSLFGIVEMLGGRTLTRTDDKRAVHFFITLRYSLHSVYSAGPVVAPASGALSDVLPGPDGEGRCQGIALKRGDWVGLKLPFAITPPA